LHHRSPCGGRRNCRLIAHVHITAQTTIGDGCTIYPFVSLGTPPQSLSYRDELTRLDIGAGLHHPRIPSP